MIHHGLTLFSVADDRRDKKTGESKLSSLVLGKKRSTFSGKIMEVDASLQTEKRLRHVLLMEELLQIVIYSNTKTFLNYQVYLECLHLLLNLMSTQMFSIPSSSTDQRQELDLFWILLLDDFSHFANGLIVRLFRNFIDQQTPPPEAQEKGKLKKYIVDSRLIGSLHICRTLYDCI